MALHSFQSNPADFASRPISASSFSDSRPWLSGPFFLCLLESAWPAFPLPAVDLPHKSEQCKSKQVTCRSFKVENLCADPIEALINRCSTLIKLKRLIEWLLRLKEKLRGKSKMSSLKAEPLSVFELKLAEVEIVKYVQRKAFPYYFSGANADQVSRQCPHSIKRLRPFTLDGILRVGGRLAKATINPDAKHPISLPPRSHVTNLIVRQYHDAVGHSGMGHTWAEIRQRYWIIKGGAVVRHVISKCELCKKRNAKVGKQFMADLPTPRLQADLPPFCNIGVD